MAPSPLPNDMAPGADRGFRAIASPWPGAPGGLHRREGNRS
jgi:hypothetical protein